MSVASVFEFMRKVVEDSGHISMKLGEEHIDLLEENLGEQQGKPSIVWVPINGQVTQYGTMRDPTSIRTPQGLGEPQQLATIRTQIDAFCWAQDLVAAERLMNDFWALMRQRLTAYAFKPVSVRWAVNSKRMGTYSILSFLIMIPVTYQLDAIATAPLTPTIDGEFVDEITAS